MSFLKKVVPITKKLIQEKTPIVKEKLNVFSNYARVELVPPTPGEIKIAFQELNNLVKSVKNKSYLNLTVRQAFLNTLVAIEIGCWFFVGEVIGRRSLVGYKFFKYPTLMDGFSLSELCLIFCCPPCPGTIVAKLAFLPPEATYSFSSISSNENSSNINNTNGNSKNLENNYIDAKLILGDKAEWQYGVKDLNKIDVCWSRNSKGNRIACMYVKAVNNPKYIILFSHGNAVDLGQMSSFYLSLATKINCNIFSYDYSGYGVSQGKPSEKNLYSDIKCAWQTLRNKYGFSSEKIILYGQSIGTVPSIDLASKYEVAAVILHSPLMSGMRVAFPQTKRTWFFDAFPNIDKISQVSSPVLVIHGTDDEVIDFSHGLAIYERCPKAVQPLWVEGAGHNDVELHSEYLNRLKQFISVELDN